MRIVFLDFDGVITTSGTYKRATKVMVPQAWGEAKAVWPNPIELITPDLVANVSTLCLRAEAGIILSTSWRNEFTQPKLDEFLRATGLDASIPILGVTPNTGHRGKEIAASVEAHGLTKNDICILEDEEDVSPFRGRQIKTSFVGSRPGFTARHLTRALRLFGLNP